MSVNGKRQVVEEVGSSTVDQSIELIKSFGEKIKSNMLEFSSGYCNLLT